MPQGREISQKVNGRNLTVVGYYSDRYDSDFMLINNNTLKYDLIKNKTDVTLCPVDKSETFSQLKAENINVRDTYAESEAQYKEQMWSSIFSTIVVSGVILIISFIEIYLIIRASFFQESRRWRLQGYRRQEERYIQDVHRRDIRNHYHCQSSGICIDGILSLSAFADGDLRRTISGDAGRAGSVSDIDIRVESDIRTAAGFPYYKEASCGYPQQDRCKLNRPFLRGMTRRYSDRSERFIEAVGL